MRRFCSALLLCLFPLPLLCSAHSAEPCDCHLPTPCRSDAGCTIPLVKDVKQCPAQTRDCRSEAQSLCESNIRAKRGFCCWTTCSSLALRRSCGDAPDGFVFDKPGIRNSTECHDPLNVREKCCLRELKRMKSVTPQSSDCPSRGSDLIKVFETVDGNRASAPNSVISDIEVLNSLEWLDAKGYLFLARNFSDIDTDGNHRLSWYEVELFCGLRGVRLPPTDIMQVKPSEITMIASQPLLIAGLISSLVVGELFGLLQVIAKHTMHLDVGPDADGPILKTVYPLLAYVWPAAYCVFQLYYWFRKIDWEVCDAPQAAIDYYGVLQIDAMSAIRAEYLGAVLLNCATVGWSIWLWARVRKCPLSPTKDLERRIYLQQCFFRKNHKIYEYFFIAAFAFVAWATLYRVLFYGTLMDIDLVGLDECKREEPDLALLYSVNERFFLWRVVQVCFISLYVQLGWGIKNKDEYEPLPSREDLALYQRGHAQQLVDTTLGTEKEKWKFFQ